MPAPTIAGPDRRPHSRAPDRAAPPHHDPASVGLPPAWRTSLVRQSSIRSAPRRGAPEGIVAAIPEAPALAERTGGPCHSGREGGRLRSQVRGATLRMLRLSQFLPCLDQVLAQPSLTAGRCRNQNRIAAWHHHWQTVVVNDVASAHEWFPYRSQRIIAMRQLPRLLQPLRQAFQRVLARGLVGPDMRQAARS